MYELFVPAHGTPSRRKLPEDGTPSRRKLPEDGSEKRDDVQFMEALQLCYSGRWKEAFPKFQALEKDVTAQKYVDMLQKKAEG